MLRSYHFFLFQLKKDKLTIIGKFWSRNSNINAALNSMVEEILVIQDQFEIY